MNNELFDIGDYVKFEEISKGGKKFYTTCVVLDVDHTIKEIIKNNNDSIMYTLLSNESEEFSKFGRSLELDIEEERNSKIDNLFND